MGLTLSQSGTTVTATSTSPLPSSSNATWPVNISGSSVAGYTKNWRITSVNNVAPGPYAFTFTAPSGLNPASGATATPTPVLSFNANRCYLPTARVAFDNSVSSGFQFGATSVTTPPSSSETALIAPP